MTVAVVLVVLVVVLVFAHRAMLRTWWDAYAGVNTIELYVTERVPDVPVWDVANNPVHARVAQELQRTQVEELEGQLVRVEDEQALHDSLLSLNTKLAGCALGEVLGCTLLFKSLGFRGVERVVPAVLLAFFLFWVTSETKRQARTTGRVLVILAYAAVMVAITVLRVLQAGPNSTSWVEAVAVGVVMLAATTGGAWLVEGLNARRVTSLRLSKERRNVRHRLGKARVRRRAAEAFVEHFTRVQEGIRRKRATTAAAYNAAHFRATAQRERRDQGGSAWSA